MKAMGILSYWNVTDYLIDGKFEIENKIIY